ncbi:MAG: hypothetical protein JXA77_09460 [Bacteroidales bacterium]|nr:hypothetical protein [Bacteroidales bacterium]MBN2817396.1 hypothetical protein [Bacteroidales bacterium]
MYKLLKINAIAIVVLGCIHLAATPFIMKGVNPEMRSVFLSMFTIAGMGTFLPGVAILNQLQNLKAGNKQSRNLIVFCIVYFLILALIAVSTMYTNPFAYIALLLGLILLIPLPTLLKHQNK